MPLGNFKIKSEDRKPAISSGRRSGGTFNPLQMLMSQQMAAQKGEQSKQNIGQDISQVQTQLGGAPPVGTTFSTGAQGPKVNVPLNRPYDQSERLSLQHASSIKKHIANLENEMTSDPERFKSAFKLATVNIPGLSGGTRGNILGIPTTMGDEKAQMVKYFLTDIGDRLLRLRSGAQINEQEYQRLRGLLPTYEDVTSDNDGTFKVIRMKLGNFRDEFQVVENLIQKGRAGFGTESSDQSSQNLTGVSQQTQSGQDQFAQERQLAQEAIEKGADPQKVKLRFRQRTGADL